MTELEGRLDQEFIIYVTGFGKTNHVRTRIEIHFIAYYNSHTQALYRHSDTTAIDKNLSKN